MAIGKARRLVVALAVVAAVAIGWHYLLLENELARAARDLSDAQSVAASGELTGAATARLRADLQDGHRNLQSATASLRIDPAVDLVCRLPWIGPQARAARGLVAIGATLSGAAVSLVPLWDEITADPSATASPRTANLLQAIGDNQIALQTAAVQVDAATTALQGLPLDRYPLLARFLPLELLSLQRHSVELSALAPLLSDLPNITGMNGPRTYLLLGLDNTELEPGGGLIGEYGLVTLDHGSVSNVQLAPSAEIGFHWMAAHGLFVPPPPPLAESLLPGGLSWDLALADWSPDFAGSAAQASSFVSDATGQQIDGVIGIDLVGFQRLVALVGGASAPQYGATLSPDDPIERLNELTFLDAPPGTSPYAVVSALAASVLARTEALPSSQLPALAHMAADTAASGHLLLFATDPAVEDAIKALGWGGAMNVSEQDYLAVVDADVHSTKLNLVLQEHTHVDVVLHSDGTATDTVTVDYKNDVSAWAQGKDPALVRALMCLGDCPPGALGDVYIGYLRIYVPRGSSPAQLREQGIYAGINVPVDLGHDEAGLLSFGAFNWVLQGRTASLAFTYTTPVVTKPCGAASCYQLHIRRQPGTLGPPVTVTWTLPAGQQLVSLALDGSFRPLAEQSVQATLTSDQVLDLSFAPTR